MVERDPHIQLSQGEEERLHEEEHAEGYWPELIARAETTEHPREDKN